MYLDALTYAVIMCRMSYTQLQDNDPVDTTSVEGDDTSVNELDGPAAVTMQNLAHVSAGSYEDPNAGGAATEYNIADLAARSDASVDASDGDSVEDVVKVTDATGDDDLPFNLPHFDAVQSPPDDHHYLDTTYGPGRFTKRTHPP